MKNNQIKNRIPLRILLIEDSDTDELLVKDILGNGGFEVECKRVERAGELKESIKDSWDLIISDFTMPLLHGSEALRIVREYNQDTPFIFFSGTIGESNVAYVLSNGAQNYVMKSDINRLLPTVVRELEEKKRKEKAKKDAERLELLSLAASQTSDSLCIVNRSGEIQWANKVFEENYSPIASGKLGEILNSMVIEGDGAEIVQKIGNGEGFKATIRVRQLSGRESFQEFSVVPMKIDGQGTEYFVVNSHDITERVRFEGELQHKATHDELTGLPNRFYLIERFKTAAAYAKRNGHGVAVMFLDLNNFKRVNDTLGHATGDVLLQQVAHRIKSILRPSDTIARHGGDEFTIVIGELKRDENVLAVLRKLMAEFDRPVIVGGNEIYVTFSTGIALYPSDGEYIEDLLRYSDAAMYKAKLSGSRQYRFYAPEMNARGNELLALEAELRRALERGEFAVAFQPMVDLHAGTIIGAEGLLRWNHPKRGLMSPADFVPLLENTGLIVPVGEWIMREVCKVHQAWRRVGILDARLCVNVSAVQFNDKDFNEKVKSTVEEFEMPADALELEITENTVIQDPKSASKVLQSLRQEGVRVSIDDFGTGYSSLSYLKRLPFNVLKIDKTFVADIAVSGGDSAIVEASISLAKKLGMEVVAEGVESGEQMQFLRMHDCDFAQGYFIGMPMDAEKMTDLLMAQCKKPGAALH